MKRTILYVCILSFLSLIFLGFTESKHTLIDAVWEKFKAVKSCYFQEKTKTGSFSVADTSGAIDYHNKRLWATTSSGGQLIEKVYCRDKNVCIYNGITEQWFNIDFDAYDFDQGFNKKKVFIFFNKQAQNNGFDLKFINEKSNDKFFILESKIKDSDQAKRYLLDNLEIIFGKKLSRQLTKNEKLLNDYLDAYTNNFINIAWVRKNDFSLEKIKQGYFQPVGPGAVIRIEKEKVYYGQDRDVKFEVPNNDCKNK